MASFFNAEITTTAGAGSRGSTDSCSKTASPSALGMMRSSVITS